MNSMELRQKISDIINQSGLPIDGVYFILRDILNEVIEIYNQQLQQQNAAMAAQESAQSSEEIQEAVAIEKTEEE